MLLLSNLQSRISLVDKLSEPVVEFLLAPLQFLRDEFVPLRLCELRVGVRLQKRCVIRLGFRACDGEQNALQSQREDGGATAQNSQPFLNRRDSLETEPIRIQREVQDCGDRRDKSHERNDGHQSGKQKRQGALPNFARRLAHGIGIFVERFQ